MLEKQLEITLEKRKQKGTLRNLTIFPTKNSAQTSQSSSGSKLIDFSSNDYLSLSSCRQVHTDFLIGFQNDHEGKMGSTGSRLLDGNSDQHQQLEQTLSQHFESSSALLFNSGYDANVSIFTTLPQPDDIILYDSLVHASVHDGMRKSRTLPSLRIPFQHNSVKHFEQVISRLADQGELSCEKARNVFVSVESVYSMDGDVCPLGEILDVAERFIDRERLCVVVDEAHSTGLYGRGGRGLCHALGLVPPRSDEINKRIRIRLMTFGKAMGSSGAVVFCSPVIRHYLINYARPLIFSTSLSHVSLLSIQASLMALLDGRSEKRAARLFSNTRRLIRSLGLLLTELDRSPNPTDTALALPPHLAEYLSSCEKEEAFQNKDIVSQALESPSPIVPLLTRQARPLAAYLRSEGLLARPICYPTVPKGQDRVRICLHADNTDHEIDHLIRSIQTWMQMPKTDQFAVPTLHRPAHAISKI